MSAPTRPCGSLARKPMARFSFPLAVGCVRALLVCLAHKLLSSIKANTNLGARDNMSCPIELALGREQDERDHCMVEHRVEHLLLQTAQPLVCLNCSHTTERPPNFLRDAPTLFFSKNIHVLICLGVTCIMHLCSALSPKSYVIT
jgi:hypothetical protein